MRTLPSPSSRATAKRSRLRLTFALHGLVWIASLSLAMTIVCAKLAIMRDPAVYITANRRNGTLYVGVTSDLPLRAHQHREGLTPGFTRRYGCKMLVYYEKYKDMDSAIGREKQLKAGSRQRKQSLIEAMNPEWRDLSSIRRQFN